MNNNPLPHLRNIVEHVEEWGWRGVPFWFSKLYHRKVVPRSQGLTIWDRNWDVLIVLDACRPDWLREVSSEFEFVGEVSSIQSVASHSSEWVAKTFTEEHKSEIEDTIYITGNYFADQAPTSWVTHFDDVSQYETPYPTPPAHLTTDRAVTVARNTEWENCIIHYMQPHKPFYRRGEDRQDIEVIDYGSKGEKSVYQPYFNNEISRDEIEAAYIDNLRYVLEEVQLLLRNIDGERVVITSDHGQALGERFLYDHRARVNHPVLREVPWVETSATDMKNLEPTEYKSVDESKEQNEDYLRALGYLCSCIFL